MSDKSMAASTTMIRNAMFQWMPWFLAFGLGLFGLSKIITIGYNASYSLPAHVYIINKLESDFAKSEFKRGDIIGFRFYGEIYPHGTLFTKHVVGVPGDVVTEKDKVFYINGNPVGKAKDTSLTGEVLEMNSFRGVIPANKFWYATDQVDSFDSRYALAGLGDLQDVVGKAYSLF